MAIITDTTFGLIKDALAQKNTILRGFAALFDVSELQMILMDVRAGNASNYAVGTEINSKLTYNGTQYDYPWIVVDNNRQCEWENGTQHPGLWLCAKYTTPMFMAFDAPEGVAATESTAQEGLYYCGISGSDYTMLDLAVGDALPYSSYTSIVKGSVSKVGAFKDGYNRYKFSALRQWLNSGEAAGSWWSATHPGDNAPGQATTLGGFMGYINQEFLDIITPVKVQTVANTQIDGGVTDTTYDYFFPLSLEEIYAVAQVENVEGPFFPYWKTATGLNSPSNDANAGRVTHRVSSETAESIPHLRSASKNTAYNVWAFQTNGGVNNNVARHDRNVLPACVIS